MAKLWQGDLNKEIENFTVGDDYLLDQKLIKYDVKVNLAHAKMLKEIGVISVEELEKISETLEQIPNNFTVKKEQEDVHTAVEDFLTEKLGDLGKKIHTGKSRNDQVMADILLFCKDELNEIKKMTITLTQAMQEFSENNRVPMPGYTHMQKAMPYSVDNWMLSFKEMLDDDLKSINHALEIIDKNPLGSAAGFGIPLKMDKQITTRQLGFKKTYQHPLFVQNSKSKQAVVVLSSVEQIMVTLNKLASDLLIFTTLEFGFFSLPDEFCTGSSIMPQKKNYDVLELTRAKTSAFHAKIIEINALSYNLPSGYNRDSQLIKKPLMEGLGVAKSVIKIVTLVVTHLKADKGRLSEAMTAELYATEKALELVNQGVPFRDAYKEIKKQFKSNQKTQHHQK